MSKSSRDESIQLLRWSSREENLKKTSTFILKVCSRV